MPGGVPLRKTLQFTCSIFCDESEAAKNKEVWPLAWALL